VGKGGNNSGKTLSQGKEKQLLRHIAAANKGVEKGCWDRVKGKGDLESRTPRDLPEKQEEGEHRAIKKKLRAYNRTGHEPIIL